VATEATNDYVHDFVWEVLRTGLMLTELLSDLVESLPDNAYPGETNAEVVIEMLIGTVRPVVDTAGEELVRRAAHLLVDTRERTATDLRLAMELAGRMRSEGGGERRWG
jgi:hypothetical protein